jgi:hypothetical protein
MILFLDREVLGSSSFLIIPPKTKKAGREGGTSGNLRRATGTISGDETPEYQ